MENSELLGVLGLLIFIGAAVFAGRRILSDRNKAKSPKSGVGGSRDGGSNPSKK